MARGRPPTPTYLRLLRGNPGKRPLNKNEPQPARPPDVPELPAYLTGHARQEWERVAPEVFRLGLLTTVDISAFGAYCWAYATWRTALEAVDRVAESDPVFKGLIVKARTGTPVENPLYLASRQPASDMLKFAAEFGMTPAARARLSNPLAFSSGPSKFDGLLGGFRSPDEPA
jgi:P27 family predicted phage terminase small subunit